MTVETVQPASAAKPAPVHRQLRFASLDDLLHEVARLQSADEAGALRRSGEWTAGQCFGHLAAWIDYAYVGYPMRVPALVRLFLRRGLRKILRDGMRAGTRIPRSPSGTYATDLLETAEGAKRLRAAIARLQAGEEARFHSPAFGAMPLADRIALNLRHAELHLGYLHPE